ncbi:SGNH hydrolase-type esterase domain-containing protein [Fimicolochytrium jonesii]|uniref:SGNH hydrolase-type esterase domain-containing protein n=1 Tax=Fimicolochytrium jonesii TaxID=1396493 RepID=UPI0022FDF646|nr:SGNH hydrolase-type esterase domain-containing protein [Fimicolochytrium jonesii]KAI8825888.1 SGNH hydrolase-type esterase domain-containing protein [Fimicolochytrium jonesii]
MSTNNVPTPSISAEGDPDKIVLFGDSLTQFSLDPLNSGWGSIVANAYARKHDILNRGYSGYNTEWAKHILPSVLAPLNPSKLALVIILLGANDSALKGSNNQHVTVEDYRSNLKQIIQTIRAFSSTTRILLISPPVVHEAKWAQYLVERWGPAAISNHTVKETRRYRDACIEVARETQVPVLDTWASTCFGGKSTNKGSEEVVYDVDVASEMLSDGIHLSAAGNSVLGREVLKKIKKEWKELDWEKVNLKWPLYDTIDVKDVPACLFRA